MLNHPDTVLITGASAGIGMELAKLFAVEGASLVLVARRQDRLDQLAGDLQARCPVGVRTISKDLSRREAPQEIFDELNKARIPVDVVVNNAGFGARGKVAELPVEQQMQMLQVNIGALTHLTRLFLPGMLERGRGGAF